MYVMARADGGLLVAFKCVRTGSFARCHALKAPDILHVLVIVWAMPIAIKVSVVMVKFQTKPRGQYVTQRCIKKTQAHEYCRKFEIGSLIHHFFGFDLNTAKISLILELTSIGSSRFLAIYNNG